MNRTKVTENFVKVGVSLRERLKELNDTELRVLLALGLRINEERQCWPTISAVAVECIRSERQVQRAITKLLAKNFVWVGRRAGGRGKANIYTLNGYFAYGTQPVQLMAPFMAPAEEQKGDTGDGLSPKKGDIPIVSDLQKGDIPIVGERVTSPQAGPVRKKNHIRRTNEEEGRDASPPESPGTKRVERPEGDPRVRETALALEKERGYKSPNYGGEARAIKWMLNQGHSPENILACWRALKRDPWWASRELLLMSVQKEIGQWVKAGCQPDAFEKKGAYGKAGGHYREGQGRGPIATTEEFEQQARELGQAAEGDG